MEQTPQGGQAKHGINQNMVIAIIGAVATIVAALIPSFTRNDNSQSAPTAASTMAALPSDTALPPPTFTFTPVTPEPIATETLTPTPLPPSETPTTPVGVYDVYLALDRAGNTRSTTFGPLQTVYVFFSINDPSKQNLVRVEWRTLNVKGRAPDSYLYGDESTILTPKHSFEVAFTPWPLGTYKVILFLNGTQVSTQEFEIK